jgi:hypothetical protein
MNDKIEDYLEQIADSLMGFTTGRPAISESLGSIYEKLDDINIRLGSLEEINKTLKEILEVYMAVNSVK